jgi:putative ABC transport system substrate-binding protein
MAIDIGRRQFVSALGGATLAWPLAARAQQPAFPVIGFVHIGSPAQFPRHLVEFRKGLNENGFVEGQNVAVEYRWADGQLDRLPSLVDDLVSRHVAVMVASTLPAALAAKAATTTIPVVFQIGGDPVKQGLVDSLNRPGGNITGFTQFGNVLAPKQFELLHEIVPKAVKIGLFVNPKNPNASSDAIAVQAAAEALGLHVLVMNVTSERDVDANFAALVENGVGALLVSITLGLGRLSDQTIALAAHYAIPAIYAFREEVAAGGLMSYGSDNVEVYHQLGSYVGRILKGAKPADLPVQQSTKVELIINLKTAKALGITVPLSLLGRADEVIE